MTRTALPPTFVGGILGGALLLAASHASAQVAVNSGALNQLQPEHARHSPARHAPSRRARQPEAPQPEAPRHPLATRPAAPAAPTATNPAAPTAAVAPKVPAAPPNPAVLPPPAVAVPTAAPPPIPPIPVATDAPGAAEPVQGGLRITFGKDHSDLSPATVAAIQEVAGQAKGKPGALDVTAYAAGVPDDPSTPRRLSLARALAVRSVLLHEGIESPRIYVRAMGAGPAPSDRAAPPGTPAAAPAGPADRVDLIQEHAVPSGASSTERSAGK